MLMGVFWRQRLSDCVRVNPFFFLRRKKSSKRKSCKWDAPLTPAVWGRHHNRMGNQREDSVQAAQRGQVRARTVKHPAANTFLGFPSRGSQRGIVPRGSLSKQVFPRIQKLSPLCTPPLLFVSPVLPVPRGVSGGGAALSSLCRRPFLRRHNESHFAAQSPERSFFFPLFLSPRKKKRLLAATQSQNLCRQNKTRQ